MKPKYDCRPILFFLLFVGLGIGCSTNNFSSIDQTIQEMIGGGLSTRRETIDSSDGIFADFKVYRDGQKDGVVFEFVYADGVELDRSQLAESVLKPALVADLATDSSTKTVLSLGIHLRYIYKEFDGTVVTDLMITANDL